MKEIIENKKMDKKPKILLSVFLVITIISVVVTFYKYIIIQDIVFYTDEELFQQSLLEE